jgi:hypothetical protein
MQALQVFAGPRAAAHLRERGLRPQDVRVVPAAAGGPKGLLLNPLDRFLFGHWFAGSTHTVHLAGASIGAWRMACASLPDADAALAELADQYIGQRYEHAPGKRPTARHVTEVFRQALAGMLGRRAAEVLASPRYRVHVFTSRGRGLLHRPGALRMPLGWASAFAANAVSRRALGGWMERVVFSDPRDALPIPLQDYPTRRVPLGPDNLARAVLASCTIPFALQAVQDVPGAPRGTYWDGGITDYHLHLDYPALWGEGAGGGLVLYPHFVDRVVPGWLDKAWKRRHRATAALANLVLLSQRLQALPARRSGPPARLAAGAGAEPAAGRRIRGHRANRPSDRCPFTALMMTRCRLAGLNLLPL